jgi:hypothetical protein
MFGSKSGEERFKGALNQYVVTKLSGTRRSYYVFHTRGEDPTSILIAALVIIKTSADDQLDLVSSIKERRTFTASAWNTVSCCEVLLWGHKDQKVFLHEEVTKGGAVSRVLGYEKGKEEDDVDTSNK